MQETHCPLCHDLLEVREVAPCEDCGGDPKELSDFRRQIHQYNEYEIFPGLRLVLCDFCDVDFDSYDPTIFGLPERPPGVSPKIGAWSLIRTVADPRIEKDKYCTSCGHRLAFLRFVEKARLFHAK